MRDFASNIVRYAASILTRTQTLAQTYSLKHTYRHTDICIQTHMHTHTHICTYVCAVLKYYAILVVVDEKERKNGNDPEKELVNNGFQDYQRP